MPGPLAPEVVEAAKKILDGNIAPLCKLQELKQLFMDNGLCYNTTALPSEMLVHPSNRGGRMLGWKDVWKKGMAMLEVGVKKELLVDPVCFEMSSNPSTKKMQLEANIRLAEAFEGALAMPTSKERFLTVGSSHTVAFCKAVGAVCRPGGQPDRA